MPDGSVAHRMRVNFVYSPSAEAPHEEIELPFKILMIGDYLQRPDERPLEDRKPVAVDKDNFNGVLAEHGLELNLVVPDRLAQEPGAEMAVNLKFEKLSHFTPEGIANQVPGMRELLDLRQALKILRGPLGGIPAFRKKIERFLGDDATRQQLTLEIDAGGPPVASARTDESLLDELLADAQIKPTTEGYDVAKRGLAAFLNTLMAPRFARARVDISALDEIVGDIDRSLSAQVHEVLHHPAFQRLEATWRTLKFVVDRVDFRENIELVMWAVSKEELEIEFEDSSGPLHTALCGHLWIQGPGGVPFGLVVGDYEFSHGDRDLALLEGIAAVMQVVGTPFVAAASPMMFNASSWEETRDRAELQSALEDPPHARWQRFREREDARFVGLCLPRFLLRLPYGGETVPVKGFRYDEDVTGGTERYLWGSAAAALATRVADSFAKYRWCPNILGPQGGGAVENLPLYPYTDRSGAVTQIATEVPLTERREYELSEEGFIALTFRKGLDHACFFSANSCGRPKRLGPNLEERANEIDRRLAVQLPYLFVVLRVDHYARSITRTYVGNQAGGRWRTPDDVVRGLNEWLEDYHADMDVPRARPVLTPRFLLKARVELADGEASWWTFRYTLRVCPHWKYRGSFFTLSLTTAIELPQ